MEAASVGAGDRKDFEDLRLVEAVDGVGEGRILAVECAALVDDDVLAGVRHCGRCAGDGR